MLTKHSLRPQTQRTPWKVDKACLVSVRTTYSPRPLFVKRPCQQFVSRSTSPHSSQFRPPSSVPFVHVMNDSSRQARPGRHSNVPRSWISSDFSDNGFARRRDNIKCHRRRVAADDERAGPRGGLRAVMAGESEPVTGSRAVKAVPSNVDLLQACPNHLTP